MLENALSQHMGTMPPEFIKEKTGAKYYPFATDVYTLAATLYFLLTGRPAVLVKSAEQESQSTRLLEHAHAALAVVPRLPSEFRADVPTELDQILAKALEKVPAARYVSCRSLAKDLDKLRSSLAQGPISAYSSRPRITVGATDTLLRLDSSTRYGRTDADQMLRSELQRVVSGTTSLVVIHGESGSGKTVTAETLVPEVSQRGGLWIAVKAPLQANRPFSVLAGVANALLRPLLLIPGVEISQWQVEVSQTVGDAAMALLAPYIESDLWGPFGFGTSEHIDDDEEVNPLKRMAAESAIVRLIARVLRRLRLLVIFVDDCQWLQGPDISFVEALLAHDPHEMSGLLVLCAQRPISESDLAQAAFRSSKLSQTLANAMHIVRLGALDEKDVLTMLNGWLGPYSHGKRRPDGRRVEQLARIAKLIADSSAATPMFCRQLLITLRDQKALKFDWEAEEWVLEEEALLDIAADVHGMDAVTFVQRSVLSPLPAVTQMVLISASTISGSGPFDKETIRIATGLEEVQVLSALSLGVQKKILTSAATTETVENLESVVNKDMSYEFTHDQWIEASSGLCPVDQRAELHYLQACRLFGERDKHRSLVAANVRSACLHGEHTCFTICYHYYRIVKQGFA